MDGPGFKYRQVQKIFLFCKTPGLAVGPIQHSTQWVLGFFDGVNTAEERS